jgi:hypothetical protein
MKTSKRGPGRPSKFGRPSRLVALTLPDDTLRALSRVDADVAWAIVKLLEPENRVHSRPGKQPDVELVAIAARRSLIVVNRQVFTSLPGVSIVPLTDTRAFLALDVGRGMSDLELTVIDRLGDRSLSKRERTALLALRRKLSEWRRARDLAFRTRAIIVVEHITPGRTAGEA